MSKIVNKKILITGGAGFIGSNLCEYFLKHNEVVCLDNFSTGHRHNIEQFLSNPNFTLIEGDIRNLETCEKAVLGIDFVLHQAALGSVPRSINDPITTNEVNVSGFLNMLIASRNANVKRFIYAASSSTYGDSETLPKIEDVIGKPLSPYAVTKYVNELYADVFSKTYGVETIGLRYFNVFGRNQDDHTKNFGFLMNKQGQWSLSPAFDMTYSYDPSGMWTKNHQINLNGKNNNFTKDDIVAFGNYCNLKEKKSIEILENTIKQFKKFEQLADEYKVDTILKNTILKNIRFDL